MQTRIKFCGMTQLKDIQHAINLHVDALGFVFVEGSSRSLTVEKADELIKEIPPFIIKVGLFMDADVDYVNTVLSVLSLNLLQFHGEEDDKYCNQFGVPYLKAVPMRSTSSVLNFCSEYPSATGFVLDSHASGQMGGSGKVFEWGTIPKELEKPIILAGGLTPDNVSRAIQAVHPYAVDVSSGIETSKGIKDPIKMDLFVKEVRNG